jgi:hypothetical protein
MTIGMRRSGRSHRGPISPRPVAECYTGQCHTDPVQSASWEQRREVAWDARLVRWGREYEGCVVPCAS